MVQPGAKMDTDSERCDRRGHVPVEPPAGKPEWG